MSRLFSLCCVLLVSSICFAEVPKDLTVKTETVALFKNGLAVIRQEADIPAEGVYRWSEVPQVIHGTFFAESDLNVEIRSTQQEVKTPIQSGVNAPTLADLNGVKVKVTLEDNSVYQGELVIAPPEKVSNSLLPESSAMGRYYSSSMGPVPVGIGSQMLIKDEEGRYVFLTGAGKGIVSVETAAPLKERTEKKPVLLFTVKANNGKTSGKLQLFYLVKGAAWSPSYRINLLDGQKLSIDQTAQIRNEWLPIENAEVLLVSGFPQIETSNVRSLLHPSQVLAQFFQQLNLPSQRFDGFVGNSMMTQQMAPSPISISPDFDITAAAAGEGPDIHYQSIGKRTLGTGDTLSLSTGKGEAEYQRVLECSVPVLFTGQNNVNNRHTPIEIYDVVRFKNPLPFPMTTAPAAITENGRFLGQCKSYWVNPSQLASVKITKVMNVRVNYKEEFTAEAQQDSRGSEFFGRTYFQRSVIRTLEISNQRNEDITLNLDTAFYGQIEKIEVEPQKKTLNASDGGPNDSTSLVWVLQLKPGEKKTLTIAGKRWYPR